jgi:hypothetical protein
MSEHFEKKIDISHFKCMSYFIVTPNYYHQGITIIFYKIKSELDFTLTNTLRPNILEMFPGSLTNTLLAPFLVHFFLFIGTFLGSCVFCLLVPFLVCVRNLLMPLAICVFVCFLRPLLLLLFNTS